MKKNALGANGTTVVWQYAESVGRLAMVGSLRLHLVIAVLSFSFCQAQTASARLVVTAHIACSVSATFGEKGKMTVVAANCADGPQGTQGIVAPNSQTGLTIMTPPPAPAMSIGVETHRMSVRNKSGVIEQQMVRTTTIVPQ